MHEWHEKNTVFVDAGLVKTRYYKQEMKHYLKPQKEKQKM